MKKIIAIFLLLTSWDCILAQENKTALLLIDIQDFYFPGGFSALSEPEVAARNAALVLDYFRKNKMEVVHVMHKASKQNGINKIVMPLENEKVIEKTEVSCFNKTGMLEYLKEKNISRVVIAGMQTHMCVEAAVRAAYDNGFQVILISDACATKDLEYEGKKIPAEMVRLTTLSTLKAYAEITTAKEFLAKNKITE